MEYASPFSVIDTIAIIPTKRKTPWGDFVRVCETFSVNS